MPQKKGEEQNRRSLHKLCPNVWLVVSNLTFSSNQTMFLINKISIKLALIRKLIVLNTTIRF